MVTYAASQATQAISLNGVRYRIVGKVATSLASVYPQKQITGTGTITPDSHPWASIHVWADWRGGVGIDRMNNDGSDDNRSWISTCWLRNDNHLMLPVLTTASPTGTLTTLNAFEQLHSLIYAINGSNIYSYNDSTFTDTTVNAANVTKSTSALSLFIGGLETIVLGGSGGYATSTDGSSWTDSAKSAEQLIEWDDRIWGLTTGGVLWYTFTAGSGEVDDAQLPLLRNTLTSDNKAAMFIGPDASGQQIIYVLTQAGLFAHDAANSRFIKTDVTVPWGVQLFVGGAEFNGLIYVGAGNSVLEYNPRNGTVRSIAPNQDDGLPVEYGDAVIYGMTATDRELFVSTRHRSGAAGTFNSIWSWDTLGWQIVYSAAYSGAANFSHLKYLQVFNNARVWFSDDDTLRSIPINDSGANPKQIGTWTYAASAIHKTPWLRPQGGEINMTAIECLMTVYDTSSNENVKVEYAIDFNEGGSDTNYTTLTTIVASDGRTILSFPDNGTSANVGVDFEAIRFKLTLTRGATTTLSPDVGNITLLYRKKLRTRYLHQFDIDATEQTFGLTPVQIRDTVKTAMEKTTLSELTFRADNSTGQPNTHYVDVVQMEAPEDTGRQQGGVIRVSTVEQLEA